MGPAELFASAAITAAAVVPIHAAMQGHSSRAQENAPPMLAERFVYRKACSQAQPCIVDTAERRELLD